MELIQQLVGNLGVEEDQAKGGAGLLFNMAQEQLESGEFQQILDKVPGISDLMSAAPESSGGGGGVMGAVGGIASALGGQAGGLGNLASLAGGFSQLGLDSGMIGKFVPVVLSFVQNQGGDTIKGLLEKVLKIG
jgi:hypothetical protein